MFRLFKLVLALLIMLPLASCNLPGFKKCPDGMIDWVDILMINGITYTAKSADELPSGQIEKGNQIGTVSYQLADHACSDHRLQNGDAAYLAVGTPLYEMKGFRSTYRIVADGKVYEVSENSQAKTMADLYDIQNRVDRISIISSEDGSHISDFSKESTAAFVGEFLSSPYVGRDQLSGNLAEDQPVFLQFHLQDGSTFRDVAWIKQGMMTPGLVLTERMKQILLKETGRK